MQRPVTEPVTEPAFSNPRASYTCLVVKATPAPAALRYSNTFLEPSVIFVAIVNHSFKKFKI
nr:MAG TPA: hypothetical protein [Caudoviricetes sp.]